MASCYTEPSTLSVWIQDTDKEEKESKSPQRSSSDESEESPEPEPSLASAVRRKVSFADAFGLDLVSVKEFDNRVESPEGIEGEEYHLACIFSVPSSDEELRLRLQQNKLELESIELLPGSTTIRGTVRVLNLSFHKFIYVRTTLDGWQSHFDQRAEYVPGSSDGQTDRFSFQFTLMPPFPPDGARMEFCLCYESSTGIFWANNGGMNYVLFCHKRGGSTVKEKEAWKEWESEENDQKGKKSCLKVVKKGSCAESKPTDTSSEPSEQESPRSVENEKRKTQHKAESQSGDTLEDSCKVLAERRKRRRAAQLEYMQDYFSHMETEVQLVEPLHQEKSNRDTTVVQPVPEHSIPVMTDIFSIYIQGCNRKEQNGNTLSILPDHQIPLLLPDWGGNDSSPSSSHPDTGEIIRPDVPEKEQTEDMSADSNNAWKYFLNNTDNLDNHSNSLDQTLCAAGSNASQQPNIEYNSSNIGDKILSVWNSREGAVTSGNKSHGCFTALQFIESDPSTLSQALDPNLASDVLSYKYPEKTQISSELHTVQELESSLTQWRSGVTETSDDRHTLNERPFSEVEPMLLPNAGERAHAKDTIEPMNSKPGDKVLLEECTSSTGFLDTEMKVKADTQGAVKDTLTFTGIRNKPFSDGRESLERQHIDKREEPMKKEEHVKEENENASQMKRISWSSYSEDALVILESRLQENEKEASRLKNENSEIWISSSTSVVCDEGELYKQTECLDRGEVEAVCSEFVKKGFSDSSERQGEEISSVENIADRECENDLEAEERQSEDDDYKDKELYKELQSSPKTCPHTPSLCLTIHNCSPSGLDLTWTESVNDNQHLLPAPHMGEETLRYRVGQDLQDPGVGTEFPSPFSSTASPPVGRMSSWMLVCWASITSTLSCISGALVCAILFGIFVTAYLHDLPVCLVIYLLSACWWCRQGMKKNVSTTDSGTVD